MFGSSRDIKCVHRNLEALNEVKIFGADGKLKKTVIAKRIVESESPLSVSIKKVKADKELRRLKALGKEK